MKNLKKMRVANGLSQQDLAEKFNLTQQSIYKYENGLAEPDFEMLKNFANFFGVSIDYLLGSSCSPNPQDMFITLAPSEKEIRLLQDFRFLPPDEQDFIEKLIQKLKK